MFIVRGAVLAGGESRRMGRDKALLPVGGRPMVEIVAEVFDAIGCDPVAIIGGDRAAMRPFGRPLVADLEPGTGPLGGVVSALGWAATAGGEDDWLLIGACDLAMLTPAAVIPLVRAARDARGVDVVVARTTRIEPALAVWRVGARREVGHLHDSGERALHRVIERLASVEVALDATALRNINTPDDLPRYPGAS